MLEQILKFVCDVDSKVHEVAQNYSSGMVGSEYLQAAGFRGN